MKSNQISMMGTGRMDTRDIGLRIASIFGRYLLKTEHLHYGYWPSDLPVELLNLPKAQELYAEYLIQHIPEGVKSILDVGSGTGANAERLVRAGYQVDCVSPSDVFSGEIAKKISGAGELFQCRLEELHTDRKYDLVLFSESFQYIPMETSFAQAVQRLNPGGYLLIADFFRVSAPGTSPMGGGHRLSKFQECLAQEPFKLLFEEDITERTAPNLQLVDEALREVAIPSWELINETLTRNYNWFYRPARFFGNLFMKRKLKKIHFKYLSGERNSDNFKKFKRYMCYLLQADAAG